MEIKGVIQNCWDDESINSFNKVINLAEENNSLKNTKCFFNCVEIKGKKGLWVAMNALIDSEKENDKLKSELEELKKNVLVPKYRQYQECYYISKNKIISGIITKNCILYTIPTIKIPEFEIKETELFATREEAEEALKKMEGSV